jgi:hypothetical protein
MRLDGPRILVISARIPYLNATNEVFISELAGRNHCLVAGYGHQVSSRSIADIRREYGNFDVVFVEPWALLDRASPILEPFRPIDLFDHDIPIIANALQYDMHILDRDTVKRYRDRNIKIVSTVCSPQFWLKSFSDSSETLNVAAVGALCAEPSMVTDDYIMIPHCVAHDEFRFRAFESRRYDVSVPGVKYSFRSRVAGILEEGESQLFLTKPDLFQRIILRLLAGDQLGRRRVLRYLARSRFQSSIAEARASITCDGSIGYAVRKFFEIPALGSVLAAKFFPAHEELGFVHGETAFVMSKPEDVFDVLELVCNDVATAEVIARRGQAMVRELHTVRRRVSQFIEFVAAVGSQRRVTTRWRNGSQVILEATGIGSSLS